MIMPIRNESSFIERSLGAVTAQDYPAEKLEVLVADGRSTDATRERVIDLGRRTPQCGSRSSTIRDGSSRPA